MSARRRRTLSVLCVTKDPGPQVACILEALRDVADEIIVAVDSRIDPDILGCYASAADRFTRFEWEASDHELPWAFAQCAGDWVLKLDGDEVPSQALIDALPELVDARDVVQYWLPYRCLFPDATTWLSGWPYSNFWINRLTRADAALLWHSGLSHTSVEPLPPGRYVDAPFYHLDCVVSTAEERSAKLARYFALARDTTDLIKERWHVPFYLPERYPDLELSPVPDFDQERLSAVVAARVKPETPTPADWPAALATGAEINGHWPERELAESAYAASVDYANATGVFAGEDAPAHVRVTNEGTETWPGGAERKPLVRLGHRWIDAGGKTLPELPRTMFPAAVHPGETVIVPVFLAPPTIPGTYVLELEVVHEFVRWFGDPLRVEVDVLPRDADPTVALLRDAPERT